VYPRRLNSRTTRKYRGHQEDVSAEPARAQTPPRFPRAHGHHQWPEGPFAPPRQGPQAPFGLNQVPETIEVGKLRKRAEFQYVQKGVRNGRPTLAAQARRRDEAAGPPRVGFTATKKIGNAVVRNRAKRRLREAARRMVPLYGKAGVDYVFLARDTTGDAPWQTLLDDMKDALLRLAAALERTA